MKAKWIASLFNALRAGLAKDHHELHIYILKFTFLAWMTMESIHALVKTFHELFGRVA